MSDDPLIDDSAEPQFRGSGATFPELDWRASDIVIGIAPIIAARLAGGLLTVETLREVALPVTIIGTGWMWLYPAAMAKIRGAGFRLPSARVCLTESLVAVPTLFLIWMGLGAVMAVTLVLFPAIDKNTNPFVEPAVGNIGNPYLWGMMLIACTIAPFGEELFFRGMLYQWLKQHVDVRSAILLQGIIFGFIHTYGVLHSVLASFLGIAFALVYELRKTIVTPVTLHVLQNTAAMIGTLVMAQVIANGPYLGVYGEANGRGCQLTQVQPGGSADRAGLRVGDIIVVVDNQQIFDFSNLKTAIREHRVGDTITVQYLRDDKTQRISLQLQGRSPSDQ